MKRIHRNSDDPDGAPDPWDPDQPVWPPNEPQRPELEGTPAERLDSALSFLDRAPGIEARVRACLLAEGLPELYAEYVASEVAEGWANGDPVPLYTMPGYVPPQDDQSTVDSSPQLKAAVDAWHEKWEAERQDDEYRSNPSRWRLLEIKPSWIGGKKLAAIFRDETNDRSKTVHFGATGYEDFTTHRDPERRERYLERHGRGHENWDDPTTPGALSRWILWNKPTLKASIADFKWRFRL